MAAGDMSRVRARADHDEIVPGDLPEVDAVPLGDKLLLGLRVVRQHKVSVAVGGCRQCLAGALRENTHGNAGFLREQRQDVSEQPGIVYRGRRCQHDRLRRRLLAGSARAGG
jgi:hypothetical protein